MSWRPEILDPEKPADQQRLAALLNDGVRRHDAMPSQQSVATGPSHDRQSPTRWVYYPWRSALVHVRGPDTFHRIRLDRNRNHITEAEQRTLQSLKIGIVGLSVGHAIAHLLAMEGLVGTLRLADHDTLDLTNLNRVPATLLDLGTNKAVVCARRVLEIDPYLKVEVFDDGIHKDNLDAFLEGLDVVVEECDALDWKIRVREEARARGICTLMATSDRGLLDVERFDREPRRPLLHGLVGALCSEQLGGLSTEQKVPHALAILGGEDISSRLAASLIEVGQSLETWPQLGSEVVLGATQVAHAVRRFGLGQHLPSGRQRLDLDRSLPAEVSIRSRTAPVKRPRTLEGDLVQRLATAASWAPSAANSQPWLFSARGDTFRITLDERRRLGLLDIDGRASLIGLGAAAENARIHARAEGLQVEIAWSDYPVPRATLHLAPGSVDTEWAPMLARRRTDRRLGDGQPLPASILRALSETGGPDVRILEGQLGLVQFAEILGRSDQLRFTHPQLHRGLIRELRWRPALDGIEAHTLGLDEGDLAKMRVAARPEVMALVRRWNGGRGLRKSAHTLLAGTSALAIVSFEEDSDLGYARAGATVQRIWHHANRLGVSVHPVAPITTYVRNETELDERFLGQDLAEARSQHAGLMRLLKLGTRTLALPMRLTQVVGDLAPQSGRRPVRTAIARESLPPGLNGSPIRDARLHARRNRLDLTAGQGTSNPASDKGSVG